MIKCPLCGWNNAESTQLCASCGGDLERRTGLIREADNPDCYSFTPPRRIIDKGVGAVGSANDLIFKFSTSRYVVLLIIAKVILFLALPYASISLYRDGNTLFYIFIPLTSLHVIEVAGWIMFSYGGRRKKRVLMSLGMKFLYAFHAIAMAYCVLTVLITLYISIAVWLSINLGASFGGIVSSVSSRQAVYSMAMATVVLFLIIVFLNICAKFFYYTHDIFTKNSVKYYRFTGVIAVGFIILTCLSLGCVVLMMCKDLTLEFISRHELLKTYIYSIVQDSSEFVVYAVGLVAVIALLSAVMVIEYMKNYKKLFVIREK